MGISSVYSEQVEELAGNYKTPWIRSILCCMHG